MTLYMYDSITAANLPEGGACYAGYGNGAYANVSEIIARFPGIPVEAIDVLNAGIGTVLDVERGDAQPADIPGWLENRRSAGVAQPAIYAGLITYITSIVPLGRPPRMWTAHYTGIPHLCDSSCVEIIGGIPRALPAGWVADATQYADPGPYDTSLLGPRWLAVPPAPTSTKGDDPLMIMIQQTPGPGADPGIYMSDGITRRPIANVATVNGYKAAGIGLVMVPAQELALVPLAAA